MVGRITVFGCVDGVEEVVLHGVEVHCAHFVDENRATIKVQVPRTGGANEIVPLSKSSVKDFERSK